MQETGVGFFLCIAQKFLSANFWSVASWKSDQRMGMVPSGDEIHALHLIH